MTLESPEHLFVAPPPYADSLEGEHLFLTSNHRDVAFLFCPSTQTQNKKSITKKPASLVSKNKVARAYGKP